MELLVQQGKVLYIGSSNFAGWHIAQAMETARHRRFLGLVSEQSLYNLNQRTVELEVIPACRAYGLGFIPWSPLAGGMLAGTMKMEADSGRRSEERIRHALEQHRTKLEAFAKLCADMGEEPANVTLAWLLHQDVVTAPIIGPRTVEQLEGAARALDIELSTDALNRLDEIWPGPSGPAPEAYAW
jgi:aryl-alcohol dehydrogenase-like predicted oxidoreductase